MTPAMRAAVAIDGPGPCRDAARALAFIRRAGRDGVARHEVARYLHVGDVSCRKLLDELAKLGAVECCGGWGARWRVSG
jgi:hypothetical protein